MKSGLLGHPCGSSAAENALRRCAALALALLLSLPAAAADAVSGASEPASPDPKPILLVAYVDTLVNPLDAFSLRDTMKHLEEAMPSYRWRFASVSAAEGMEGVRQASPDFLIAPAGFLPGEASLGYSRIATRKTVRAERASRSAGAVFLVRNEKDAPQSLESLRGLRAGTGLPTEVAGWLAAQGEIARAGHDPESFFSSVIFRSNAYPDVLSALAAGQIDVAVLPSCLLETVSQLRLADARMFRAVGQKQGGGLACLHSTDLYPDIGFLAKDTKNERLVRDVTLALLGGTRTEDPGGARFEWIANVSEQPTLELMKTLRKGPYAYLRDMSPAALWRRFRGEITAGLALLMLLVLNEARLHYLVRRRTAQVRRVLREKETLEAESAGIRARLQQFERRSIVQQMSGMIAHEINAPVGAVRSYAMVARMRAFALPGGSTDRPLGEALAGIDREAERIAQIVSRVRGYAKARREEQRRIDLGDVMARAARAWRAEQSDSGTVRIAFARPQGEAPVLGNALELELLFLNLIRNAAEAVERENASPRTVFLSLEGTGEKWSAAVENPGAPLSDEELQSLRTLSASVSPKPGGLGLGMTICRGIADAHGAELRYERRPGGGTRAAVVLDRLEAVPGEKKS